MIQAINKIHPNTSTRIHPKKCKWSIKSLDILGDKFKLNFSTKSGKFQTALGGYLTIAISLLSLATFVVILSQYFIKDSPVVTNSSEFGSQISQFNLYDENLFAPMGLGLGADQLVPGFLAPKYTTVLAVIEETVFNNATQTMEVTSTQNIDFTPCIDLNDSKIENILMEMVPFEEFKILMMCPKFTGIRKHYFVKNDPNKDLQRTIKIKAFPCSIPDRAQCAGNAELAILRLDIGQRMKFVITSNYTDPERSWIPRSEVKMQTSTHKKVVYELKQNKILGDTQQFFEPSVRSDYATANLVSSDFEMRDKDQIYCTRDEILSGACKPYVTLTYKAGSEVNVIRRNYKTISTMMGEIGGVLKVMSTLVFFFYSFYNIGKVKSFLGLKILGMSSESLDKLRRMERAGRLAKKGSNTKIGVTSKARLQGVQENES